ncbi:hypothetical protein RRG08_057675 [Elysia crispata]|uniref:Uncharacterized protein n=1 Tax=Elysia crispata TaxID=231223 RepID=A0AAE0XZR8_9GAST|nr:hypothetical protein RRG08_057675 [Elysia crispata]
MKSLGSSWSRVQGRSRGSGRGRLGKTKPLVFILFSGITSVFSSPSGGARPDLQDQLKSLEYSILTEKMKEKGLHVSHKQCLCALVKQQYTGSSSPLDDQ